VSGPPFPRAPRSGTNAIGQFKIGVSPIGTIPPFDWWDTCLAQYANSPIITGILDAFAKYLDPTANLDLFFDMVLNIETAQGHGLDVLGRIIGVTRTLQIPGSSTYLGFSEAAEPTYLPFGYGVFYAGAPLTTNFNLADNAYRALLTAKALANISDGSIAAMNQILLRLFAGRGNAYVIDNGNMTMVYRTKFALQPYELAILQTSGVMPKPAGVSISVVQGP
jgi:hypothetical protein